MLNNHQIGTKRDHMLEEGGGGGNFDTCDFYILNVKRRKESGNPDNDFITINCIF